MATYKGSGSTDDAANFVCKVNVKYVERIAGHEDATVAVVGSLLGATAASAGDAPTFYKDVLPILQTNCQTCHRQGEVAPMALMTYEQTRPWAVAIKKATQSKAMPPWFAEAGHVRYTNEAEKVLSPEALDTLARWADGGAPAGDPATAPAPRVFPTGWNITPDVDRGDAEAVRAAGARHHQLQVRAS